LGADQGSTNVVVASVDANRVNQNILADSWDPYSNNDVDTDIDSQIDISTPEELRKTIISRFTNLENSNKSGANASSDVTTLIVIAAFDDFVENDLDKLNDIFLGKGQTLPNEIGLLFWECYLGE
jgi:hypothetical protein